jgi:hypothetical protein
METDSSTLQSEEVELVLRYNGKTVYQFRLQLRFSAINSYCIPLKGHAVA